MVEKTDPVQAALDAYAAAVAIRDVSAFVALYADDVHAYDAWDQWQFSGIEAWRAMVTGWFTSISDENIEVTYTDLQTSVGDSVAFGHADVTYTAFSVAGERLRSMTNRFTFGMELQAGTWKIVHEHSSLPIDLESNSPIPAP
ncbi:YybH family protein [Mycetocola zhadangensis]|jgi:uncharacterized protein (TIGR02246 family)|uniref:YybH family protein n=1 Tax=Mycetocola zhadangensis TaxID=1164595 RepID=UPI003A4DC351